MPQSVLGYLRHVCLCDFVPVLVWKLNMLRSLKGFKLQLGGMPQGKQGPYHRINKQLDAVGLCLCQVLVLCCRLRFLLYSCHILPLAGAA